MISQMCFLNLGRKLLASTSPKNGGGGSIPECEGATERQLFAQAYMRKKREENP